MDDVKPLFQLRHEPGHTHIILGVIALALVAWLRPRGDVSVPIGLLQIVLGIGGFGSCLEGLVKKWPKVFRPIVVAFWSSTRLTFWLLLFGLFAENDRRSQRRATKAATRMWFLSELQRKNDEEKDR